MDKAVGMERGIFLEGVFHGRFEVRVSPRDQAQNEVTAGRSLDLASDPMELVGIVGAKIRLRFAV